MYQETDRMRVRVTFIRSGTTEHGEIGGLSSDDSARTVDGRNTIGMWQHVHGQGAVEYKCTAKFVGNAFVWDGGEVRPRLFFTGPNAAFRLGNVFVRGTTIKADW